MSWRAASVFLLLAWGTFAFGAVYRWALIPLFAGCAALGLSAWAQQIGARRSDVLVTASLAFLIAAIGLQVVPLQADTIRWLSPETDILLRRAAIGYPALLDRHALSIEPAATIRALAAASALAVLFLGLSRTLTDADAQSIAGGVAVLGLAMSLVGVVQKAQWNGRIYGFWTPVQSGDSYGPFVNRNHYAGWMLMALPLALGYFCCRLRRSMRHARPGWRSWSVWLSSAAASTTVLSGLVVLVMAIALTLTLSRSGIIGMFAALLVSGWFVIRRQAAGPRRSLAAAFVILLAVVSVSWAGLDRLDSRFSQLAWDELSGRVGVWGDTWRLARHFRLVGTGLNTFRTVTLFYPVGDLSYHFAQAHNDYLQLLSEGGALVCIPAGVVVALLVRAVRRSFRGLSSDTSDYWIRVGAMTGLGAIALQETADFSLQMPGNAALFVVLLAIVARRPSNRHLTAPA